MTDHPPDHRPTFILRIEGRPGAAGIHALRFLLKRLLRQYGFVCRDIREESVPAPDVSNQIADVFTGDDHGTRKL